MPNLVIATLLCLFAMLQTVQGAATNGAVALSAPIDLTPYEGATKGTGQISGVVVDFRTKLPVKDFSVFIGDAERPDDFRNWKRAKVDSTGDGKFRLEVKGISRVADWRRHYVLKVEAEGYLPALSPRLRRGHDYTETTFELRPGRGLNGIVRLPNGQPAEGAELKLIPKGLPFSVGRDSLKPQSGVTNTTKTDAGGRFSLAADPDAIALLAIHRDGFALLTQLTNEAVTVQLRSWGRITGKMLARGKPVTGERLMLNLPLPGSASIHFLDHEVSTGIDGTFQIEAAPPGDLRLVVLIPDPSGDSLTSSHLVPITVTPGATTEVRLGESGRTIVGRLALSDPSADYDFSQVAISLTTPAPDRPASTSSADAIYEWQMSPQYQEWQMHHRRYEGRASSGGTFIIDAVEPGTYSLYIRLMDKARLRVPGKMVRDTSQTITIPDENSAARKPVQIGTIVLPVEPIGKK